MNGQGHLRGRTLQRRCEGVAAALQSRSSFRGTCRPLPPRRPPGREVRPGGRSDVRRDPHRRRRPARLVNPTEGNRPAPRRKKSGGGWRRPETTSIDLRLPVGAGMRRGTDSGGEGPLPHCPGPPVASRSTPSRVLSGKAISYADAHRGASDRIAVEEGFGQPDTGEPQAPQLEGAPRLRDLPVFGYTP